MTKIKTRRAKAASVAGGILLAIGLIFFLLRGPYLSNSIKRIVIPVLENATRERIIIDKAVINLFPFYLQAKGFKLFDKDGNRLLWITKTRVYIDVLGLLSHEIRVRKLTLLEPDLTASDEDIKRILGNLKNAAMNGSEGSYKVSMKNIKMSDGSLVYKSTDGSPGVSGKGLYLDMNTRNDSSALSIVMEKGRLLLPDNSVLEGSFEGKLTFTHGKIEITDLKVRSRESSLSTRGNILISSDGRITGGRLSVKSMIDTSAMKDLFALKQAKEGTLSFEGAVQLVENKDSQWPSFDLDLKTDSRFYLETLMDIIGVDETVTGALSVKGSIKGMYPDLIAEGEAYLANAVFDTLPIDDAKGQITYEGGKLALHGFTAHGLSGRLAGDARILIPGGDYNVDANIYDIKSSRFLRYIGWDPHLPEGKMNGRVHLSHVNEVELAADIHYENTAKQEGDVRDRLRFAHAGLALKGRVLDLREAELSTDVSDLFMKGVIDFGNETLNLHVDMKSRDSADLTAPLYTKISAPSKFTGILQGPDKDPELKGRIEIGAGSIEGVGFDSAYADITYRTGLLSVEKMVASQDSAEYDLSGTVAFGKADQFFSFEDPFYRAKGKINNVEVGPYLEKFYGPIPLSGKITGKVSIEGDQSHYLSSGDVIISESNVYGQHIDKINASFVLKPDDIELTSFNAHSGGSYLEGKGTFSFNKDFNLVLSSKNIQLCDLEIFRGHPLDGMISLDLAGKGNIDNPDLGFSAHVHESFFNDVPVGKGELKGTLKDKALAAEASFLDGLVTAEGNALLSDATWHVNGTIHEGRYDSLVKGYMKEVPDDFLLLMGGGFTIEGQGKRYSIRSTLASAKVNMYGYELTNHGDFDLEFKDNEFIIHSLSMSGENADFLIGGSVHFYDTYDLHAKGTMGIEPLKALYEKVSSLRGRSSFDVDITGKWGSPELNGEITVHDGTAILSDIPYKLGPLNGTLILKNDYLSFDSVSSKFAGGSVLLTGAGYLDHMSIRRFYMNADFDRIRLRPEEGLYVTVAGGLYYETSPERSSLTGNVDIKKARYTRKIDWKRWVLGLNEMKARRTAYPSFLSDTELNIQVRSDENILIDNNIARAPLKVSLTVSGTVSNTGLLGRIESNEGSVYFRGNEFHILEGSSVDFLESDRIVPFFHIIADTYIGDYYVKLALDGTMEKFSLSLSSDPPLSENDILALLTIGKTTTEAKGIAGGIAAGEAAALLTGGLQDKVEEEVQYVTGFEKFEIEPHTTTEGAFVPRVTVGKRLFEDKVFVTYSYAIGTVEEDVVTLEYKMDRNISLIGSRNEIGSVGVDLKYKLEFD